MNIEEVVRIHENIRRWLFPRAVLHLFFLLPGDEVVAWASRSFKQYLPPKDDLVFTINRLMQQDTLAHDMLNIMGTMYTYLRADIKMMRSIELSAAYATDAYSELISNLKIAHELEKRDEGLCQVYGGLFEMFEKEAKKCKTYDEIHKASPAQIIHNLRAYENKDKMTRAAHCWACVTSTDELKAGLSTPMIIDAIMPDLIYVVNDYWQQAHRDIRKKDAQITEYLKDKRHAEQEASKAKEEIVALKATNAALEERIKELENHAHEPKLPPDIEKLKEEIESLKEINMIYEQENAKLRQEIEALRQKNMELESLSKKSTASPAQQSCYDLFAAYVKASGYDPELVSTIIIANRDFRNKHGTPHFKKNTEERLKEKSLIKDFDKTLRWLISEKVVLVKEGIGTNSVNTHFSEIAAQPLRDYVSSVVNKQ
ncbi:MAG: hypothetical protein QXT19_05170 [Candidatus Woesearchaeota archaeon]